MNKNKEKKSNNDDTCEDMDEWQRLEKWKIGRKNYP